MNRSLLTPRWLLVHLLFVAAVVATVFLTWWQWDRAHEAGGSFQNLGYSLQWPLFGGFAVFLWYRLVQMDLQGQGEDSPSEESDSGEPASEKSETTVTGRRLVPPPARAVRAEEDPELAAYNEYLAELNESEHSR